MPETVLSVKKLVKKYGNFLAVNNLDFQIYSQEIFALIGPNGAGKSTAIKMVATILNPTKGEIKLLDQEIHKNPNFTRSMLSYLPEEAGAYKNLKGINYLKLMAELYCSNNQETREAIARAILICGLGKRLDQKISEYSKGMVRKLLLARTLMVKPKLAILDEPTSGLDVINAHEIRQIIKNFSKEGMTVLLSSHNMLEIEFLSDRVALINKGKIIETGTPEELKTKYHAKNLEEVFVKVAE